MKTTLQIISSIQSGIYVKPDYTGEVVYLQAKHFTESGILTANLIKDLNLTNQTKRHLLQQGDILFAAKGNKNFATVYEAHNGACVASSIFMVIRINEDSKEIISSDFLAWYLNSPSIQTWLKGKAIGSALQSISKAVLLELEVAIPSLEKQNAILKINALRKNEQTIQNKLSNLKEQYIEQLLSNSLK